MLILTLRTDNPESEIGLYVDNEQVVYEKWQAHRQLAETLHTRITDLLKNSGKQWSDIEGVVAYEGPGSFTGLRIGLSVANAIAGSYDAPITATTGDTWIEDGLQNLLAGKGQKTALPEYGAPVHITAPKK